MSDAQGSMYRKPAVETVALPLSLRPTRSTFQARFGWLVFAGTAIALTSIAVYPNLPRSYQATSLVLLQPTDRDGQPTDDASSRNALDENAIQTYRDILASRTMLRPLVQRFRDDPEFNPAMRPTPAWLAHLQQWFPELLHGPFAPPYLSDVVIENNLRKHLVIQRDRKSYALKIGFASANPAKAALMANELASSFISSQVERKQRVQAELTGRLDRQVTSLEKRAHESEARVNGYRVTSGLIHRGERLAAEHQLQALSTQLAKATADAEIAEARAQSLTEMQRSGELDSAPEVMASPVIQAVKEKLMALNSSVAPTGLGLTVMRDLKTAIGGEAKRIVRAAQIQATLARRHADELRADITRIDGRLMYWQEADRQLRDLQRVAEADDAALKQAMAQSRTQAARMVMLRPDAEVIAPAAVPSRPSFPNLPLYGLGTLMMVILVCGMILALPAKPAPRRASALAED